MSEPSKQDLDNAAFRAEIARKEAEAYGRVVAWAWGKFGPYYLPRCRRYLLDSGEERLHRHGLGPKPLPKATCYTARHRSTGEERHFTVAEDGKVTEYPSYQAAFGAMLLEPHPSERIEVRGEQVAPHRYSLNWAGYEVSEPLPAEELAARRQRRQQKKEEKLDREFAEQAPLFAAAGLTREDFERLQERKE